MTQTTHEEAAAGLGAEFDGPAKMLFKSRHDEFALVRVSELCLQYHLVTAIRIINSLERFVYTCT